MKRTMIKPAQLMTVALAAALAWGCSDNDKTQLTPEQQQQQSVAAAQDNSQIIFATQEMMDATSGAFAEEGITEGQTITQGRVSTGGCRPSVSGNFNLNTSFPDSLIYSGTITIDYGDGSTCDASNKRTGKISDTFVYAVGTKGKFLFSTSEQISFTGYKKDTVQFDGNVILKSATNVPTTVEAQNAKMTYPDATWAQWSGLLSFQYDKIKKSRDWAGGSIAVTGSLNGTSREGAGFSASISRAITFKNTCPGLRAFIPLTGTVDVTANGVVSTIDYGDGSCDKTYTITSNGTTTVHTWEKKNL